MADIDSQIRCYMSLWAAHLTKREWEALRAGRVESLAYRPMVTESGVWTYAPDPAEDEEAADRARECPNLQAAIELARSHGCRYLEFDVEEDEVSELPTFEW